jgi:DNA-binding NtrC family response regulator
LSKGGLVFLLKRVETEAAFLQELKSFEPDIILADYSLPYFDGISALEIARTCCPEVPFILISGTVNEGMALESIRLGATDYIFKYQLSRLVPSVNRALREANERSEYKRVAEVLIKREEELGKRLKELEKFYDMAIGRELRMLELKEEIESLTEEIERYKSHFGVCDFENRDVTKELK